MLTDSMLSRYNDDFNINKKSMESIGRGSRRKAMKKSLKKIVKRVNEFTISSPNNRINPEEETATTESATSSNVSKSKTVSFGEINVKHFPVIMADNPTCKFGPPLTLDWLANEEDDIKTTVDNYEQNLKSSSIITIAAEKGQKNPKLDDYVRLSIAEREKILKHSGYTPSQIRKELETINIERMERIRAARRSDSEDKWAAIKVD